jgi:hypothetical protein
MLRIVRVSASASPDFTAEAPRFAENAEKKTLFVWLIQRPEKAEDAKKGISPPRHGGYREEEIPSLTALDR